ncbi:hypothetical protein ISCGN_024252 [Ixodes scapularis]
MSSCKALQSVATPERRAKALSYKLYRFAQAGACSLLYPGDWVRSLSSEGPAEVTAGGMLRCRLCKYSTPFRHSLDRHLTTHTSHRPFVCNLCPSDFARKSSLTNHMISCHTREKPYRCQVCGRGFIRKQTLSDHMRIHTGEKPFQCNMCSLSFARKHHLLDHSRTHTDERPYRCDHCVRAFISKSAMVQHIKAKHASSCTQLSKAFPI